MRAQMMERGRSDLKADLFIGVVVVSGVAVVASSLRHIFTDGLEARHLAWLGIAALTLLIGRLSVKLPFPNCRVSFSDALIFLSVLVYGGDFGTLTAALDGFASSTRQNGTAHKKAFNTAGMALSVHLSAWVFARLLPEERVDAPAAVHPGVEAGGGERIEDGEDFGGGHSLPSHPGA